ncbi:MULTISPECIES: hypothetical protein [Burkholderia]|uniref:hypothetical protein n=1 Tax=Burkholderia TaxID=32008 RepID=UPI0015886919|nr:MULTISPECIES: hypothetical protein [Burkholderia]
MLSSKKFFWISLFLVGLFSGVSLGNIKPGITGDGLEYTLMSQAILDHGGANVTPHDFHEVQLYKGDAGTNVPEISSHRTVSTSPPFFRDTGGRYYSYHFWFYSLFVAPFLFLVKLFGVATPWAFVSTNLIFALVASYSICVWRGVSREKRVLLLTLFWSCGTIPYIRWTHPEVFSASFLVISMVLAHSRRYILSAIAAAMVAQQNPPALFLVAALLVIDFHASYAQTGSVVPPVRKMVQWLVCIAVAFFSTAFFYIHFKTGSLIANSGFAKAELISIGRLWSFYFDPNQGVIVLLWPLLAIVPAMVVCDVVERRGGIKRYVLAGALIGASLMLAVPSLSTTNFNSGASFILRYAYWASIPLLFAVVALCSKGTGSRVVTYLAVTIFAVANLACYRGTWPSYVYYTPITEKIMDVFPGAYNPIPEIFVERGQHLDGAMNVGNIYYYSTNNGVRKILLNGKYRDISEFKCSNGRLARDYIDSTSPVEQGWIYFNLARGCSTLFGKRGIYEVPPAVGHSDSLFFFDSANGKLYLGSGWSNSESWGTWSDAREAFVILPLKGNNVREISLEANALVNARHWEQMVDVSMNGVDAGSITLNAASNNHFDIRIPEKALSGIGQSKILRLDFGFHDAISPKELGINGDERMLAIGLISLTIR